MKPLLAAFWLASSLGLMADPAAATIPVQLQFVAPDTIQEDLVGNVKSVEEKSFKSADGIKGDSAGRTLATYNAQGCTVESSRWDQNGTLKDKSVSTYDAKGNLVKRDNSDANGTVSSTSFLTFDPTARKVTSEMKAPDGILQKRTVSTYDDFGKEQEVTHFDASGTMTGRTTLERNFHGKEVTVTFYGPDGQKKTTIDLTWNPDGSQARESFSADASGVTTDVRKEYPEHDSHGNWTTRIEKTVFEKEGETLGAHETITERTITYY